MIESSLDCNQEKKMVIRYTWGEKGEYGPFSADENGYPNAGEVVRSFRILKGLSAAKFAELYALALGEKKPKNRIWVLNMERINDVPVDITRRRAIADILGIPYLLLGIAPALTKAPFLADMPAQVPRIPKQETIINATLADHEQALTSYFDGFFHRHGQAALDEVTEATQQMSTLLQGAKEQTRQRGIILISHYHGFGTAVSREQRQHKQAIACSDQALEHAHEVHKAKPNSDLMARKFYGRGITSFEQQESTRIDQARDFQEAVTFIDAAFSYAQSSTPLIKGFICLEWGLIHAYAATSETERTAAREQLIDSYNNNCIEEEDVGIKCNLSWYYLRYAKALIALGDYTEAIGQLELAEEFTPLNFPRRFAIIDLLRAQACAGLRELPQAIIHAKDALKESKAVKSELNIAAIAQLYRQLKGQYKHASDLTELGRELAKTYPHLVQF
jgi:transcriptional regulator with XRE-family HTH domain